jgi:hypothetical protein
MIGEVNPRRLAARQQNFEREREREREGEREREREGGGERERLLWGLLGLPRCAHGFSSSPSSS